MLVASFLSVLPFLTAISALPTAEPVANAEANPYNPFYPPISHTHADGNYYVRSEGPLYSRKDLESRAELETRGRSSSGLFSQAMEERNQYRIAPVEKRGKRTPGHMKRGDTRVVKKRAQCPVATPSTGGGSASTAVPASSSAAQTTAAPSIAVPTTTPIPTTSAKPSPSTTKTTTSTRAPVATASPVTVDPAGNGPFSGWATWFDVGLSACGFQDTPGMPIVAVSAELFDNWPGYNGLNPNVNPICGQHLDISWGGKTLTVEVSDRCPGCAVRSLDLSKGAFEHFADLGVGLLGMDSYTGNITWSWTKGSGRLPQVPFTP